MTRRRNFPKGYAEILEKQHNQLVRGLQEMYQRLREASLWKGEPLDESSGRPLTHDILAALNFLEPKEDCRDEEFVEQPRSSPMLKEANDDVENTPTDSGQVFSQPTLHDIATFGNKDLSAYIMIPKSPSIALSPTTPDPHWILGQSNMQSCDAHMPPRQFLPAISLPIQLDTLRDNPLYYFGASQVSLSVSKLDNTSCHFRELNDVVTAHVTGLGTMPR
jgi:hypothetical protein